MSRGIPRHEVPKATLRGMIRAARSWHGLHGTWANKSPEYWFTVGVAQSLQEKLDDSRKWVCVEPRIREMVNAKACQSIKDFPKKIRLNGRCDLGVQRLNEDYFAAIEIKTRVYSFTREISNDIRRLCLLFDKRIESKISVCCLAIYSDASKRSRNGAKHLVAERFANIESRAKAIAASFGLRLAAAPKFGRDPDDESDCDDVDHWGVQCLSITR